MAEQTLQRMERAFKAAAAASREADNDEDKERAAAAAKRLGTAIRRKRIEDRSALERLDAGTGVGIAQTVGAPVDLANAMLNVVNLGHEAPLGGSQNIQSMMAKVGLTVPPGQEEALGRAGRVGQVVGASAVAAPAIVAAGTRAAASQILPRQVPGAITQAQPGVASAVAQDVAETAVRAPGAFITAETTAAASAGLAAFEAAQRFPDSPGVQAMAEIIGGFGPSAAPPLARSAGRATSNLIEKIPLLGPKIASGVRSIIAGLSRRGGRRRAEARVRRAVEDPDVAAARLERTDVLEDASLTAAQKIEEESLLSLEASVLESTPELSIERQRQLSDVNKVIRSAMQEEVREIPTAKVKDYLRELLDTRLSMAAARSDERLAELGVSGTQEDINRIAREEILRVRKAARNQERQLHRSIDQDAAVPTTAAQEKYVEFTLDLGKAQQEDIPAAARKFLDPGTEQAPNGNFFGDETTVRELRSLQGKLRETARSAEADFKFNEARVANELADAITEDIANTVGGPEVREAVDVAVAFSRDFNDRFTRGPVGRLLGADKRGGDAVPSSLTLQSTVGVRGPRAKVETDALIEAVRRSGDEEVMRKHISDFLITDFKRSVLVDNRVNQAAARNFLKQNEEVLARFPETRRAMERAQIAAGELEALEQFADPLISRASVFVNAPLGTEIQSAIKTAKPQEAMEGLVALTRQDPTGQAERGLKAAFMDFLMRKSLITKSLDKNDQAFVSGAELIKQLDDPEVLAAMKGLFTREELQRIVKIKNTAVVLDRARKATQAGEGVIGDTPGQITSLLGRVIGAQGGRVIAGKTGGGTVQTPGIIASQVARLLKAGVQDPARRLLNDAIQDESLFRVLLMPGKTHATAARIRARLNAWVVDVLTEQGAIDEEE